MKLNADFNSRAVVHAAKQPWVSSPTPGVERRMLFRIGDEKARATSIVRYAKDSHFPAHGHPGGEEILVLDGVFQDESGDYPAGSYMRNPPGSGHRPGSEQGCVIFVKLWQFRQDDNATVALRDADGILFDNGHEQVRLETWPADQDIEKANPKGLELLVLEGSFSDVTENFTRHSWLRLPAGAKFRARTGAHGARIWVKAGLLLQENLCAF
ncbi:MAG TPA: cupin domain-containing protein [Rhizomicrobium sp.]|jgi:anti-sigma factor ChrR (cupin superfamily)|nr:cupin domain-containing protein [Rhizomicrobium sp.]